MKMFDITYRNSRTGESLVVKAPSIPLGNQLVKAVAVEQGLNWYPGDYAATKISSAI